MKLKAEKPKNKDPEKSRRIKIGIIFAILFVVSAVPAIFQNNAFGYVPAIVVVLLFVFGNLYVHFLKKALVFEDVSELQNCYRGQESAFSISIKNRSPLVFTKMDVYFFISDLFGGDDSIDCETITLAPFERRTFDFDIKFDHIGTYEAGLKKVVLYDIFSIFRVEMENEKRWKVRVAPKVFDIAKLRVENTSASESRQTLPVILDGNDYAGTREYVIGDPIKHIHWKQSARKEDSYMTKQYETYGNTGMSIIMDMQSHPYDAESLMSVFDGVVETALSAEAYGRKNGMETEILYINRQGAKKKYVSSRKKDQFDLISDLPKISPAEKKVSPALNLLMEQGMSHYSQGNILFCTADVNTELVRTLQVLKMKRKNPVLFAIIPDIVRPEERLKMTKPLRQLDYAGVPYYILNNAQDLKEERRHVS